MASRELLRTTMKDLRNIIIIIKRHASQNERICCSPTKLEGSSCAYSPLTVVFHSLSARHQFAHELSIEALVEIFMLVFISNICF